MAITRTIAKAFLKDNPFGISVIPTWALLFVSILWLPIIVILLVLPLEDSDNFEKK